MYKLETTESKVRNYTSEILT